VDAGNESRKDEDFSSMVMLFLETRKGLVIVTVCFKSKSSYCALYHSRVTVLLTAPFCTLISLSQNQTIAFRG